MLIIGTLHNFFNWLQTLKHYMKSSVLLLIQAVKCYLHITESFVLLLLNQAVTYTLLSPSPVESNCVLTHYQGPCPSLAESSC